MPTPRKGETKEEMNARYRESYSKRWQAIRMTETPAGTSTVYVPERPVYKPLADAAVQRRSSLVDAEGNVINQWIIESPKEEERRLALEEYFEKRLENVPSWREVPVPLRQHDSNHYLTTYPIGDHHIGMLSWDKETGHDYDISIAKNLLISAFDHLIGASLPTDDALITFLGDFSHFDSMFPTTPQHSNMLDTDSRAAKMVEATGDVAEHVILSALENHKNVHVIVENGNHDPYSTLWLRILLRRAFRDNPRVTVDTSPASFHYYRWRSVLIMTHHGDRVKMENLPLLLARDRPKDWGKTEHRHIYTGHIHQRKAIDVMGVSVESFRVLPPADAWAHQQGYRPVRDMKSIMYHKDFGEVARYTFNPEMLNA